MKPLRLAIILVMLLFFALLPMALKNNEYYLHLLVITWVYTMLVISFNLYLGYVGEMNFASPALFGAGAYITGMLTLKADVPTGVGFLAAVVGCGVISFLLGLPALRLKGAYFMLITFAFLAIFSGLVNNFSDYTGGGNGLYGIPAPFFLFDFTSTFSYYYLAFGMMLLVLLFAHLLINSRLGLTFMSLRDNEALASSVGISPFRYKMTMFVISGMTAGVAGWAYAHFIRVIDPGLFGFAVLFKMIFAVILGGTGTIVGPVFGTFFVVLVPEVLRFADQYRVLIFSGILLVVIILMPKGIWGSLQKWTVRI